MSASKLQELQLTKLKEVITSIEGSSSYYTSVLSETGVNTHLASLEQYVEEFPFTTKEDLVQNQKHHPPYGTRHTQPLEDYSRFHQTSATTGSPLVCIDTNESWQWMLENWKQVYTAAGVTSNDRVFFAFSFGPFLGFWTAFEAASQMHCLCIPGGGMSSLARLKLMLQHEVTVLCCTPTYAQRLAEVALEEGLDLNRLPLRKIIVAGEPGGSLPSCRDKVSNVFKGASLFDHYGLTEVGPVAFEAADTSPHSLQVIEENYFAEIVEPNGHLPVKEGNTGELVLTTLGRNANPLLRYRTGDLVKFKTRESSQGKRLLLEGGIIGRVDDMILIRGVNIYPSSLHEIIMKKPEVQEYRVTVNRAPSLSELSVEIEIHEDAPSETLSQLQSFLKDHYSVTIPVKEVPLGTLPRFEMKARRWIEITPDAQQAPDTSAPTSILLKDVSKSWHSEGETLSVLKNLNLSVREGEQIAIVGPSGSGKSTLLNILGGLESIDSGEVTVANTNLTSLSTSDLSHFRSFTVSTIFQLHHLLPQCTALENILLPLLGQNKQITKEDQELANNLILQTGLTNRVSHLPNQLSGGERMRTAIARALITKPKVILADEPTGSLDGKTAGDVFELLKTVSKETQSTLILVTHDMTLAKQMDRSLHLKSGTLHIG